MHLAHVLGFIIATYGLSISFERHTLLVIYLLFTASLAFFAPESSEVSRQLFIAAVLMSLTISYVGFFDRIKLLDKLKLIVDQQHKTAKILKQTQKTAEIGGIIIDLQNSSCWLTEEARDLLGMTAEELPLAEFVAKLDSPELRSYLTNASAGDLATEYTTKDHRTYHFIAKRAADDSTIVIAVQNITNSKRLESMAVAKTKEVEAIAEVFDGILLHVKKNGDIISGNLAFTTLVNKSSDTITGMSLDHPDLHMTELATFLSEVTGKRVHLNAEVYLGDRIPYFVRGIAIKDGTEAIIIGLNASELKRAEKQLTAQQEILERVVDYLPHGVAVKDAQNGYRYVLWNREMEKLFGKMKQDVIGKFDKDVFDAKEADRRSRTDRHVNSTNSTLIVPEETLGLGEQQVTVHTIRVPIYSELSGSKLLLEVVQDISQQKEQHNLIERQRIQLIHASKMSTLGEMSGGVAHEVNNPLTVITGHAQRIDLIVSKKYPEDQELASSTQKILDMSKRIAKIVKGLRTFAREGAQDPFETVPMAKIITETLDLCRERFANYGVELRVPEIPIELTLECRPVQISQVILNLLNNSLDAVRHSTNPWVAITIEDRGDHLLIRESDSGNGIPEQIVQKMFNPFFTTKDVGSGTGLGLSISRGLIETHQGSLRYDPEAQHTTFIVSMPKQQKQKSNAA